MRSCKSCRDGGTWRLDMAIEALIFRVNGSDIDSMDGF